MRFTELVFIGIMIFHFSGCKNYSGKQDMVIPKIAGNIEIDSKIDAIDQENIIGEFVLENPQKNGKRFNKQRRL